MGEAPVADLLDVRTTIDALTASSRQRYLSAEQAAHYLNVSATFIRRAASDHRPRHFRVGKFIRFDPADLDAFAQVQEPTTGPDSQLVTEVWNRRLRAGR